jgi:AraC-like DNA-binding protein
MDALSNVLSMLRVDSILSSRFEGTGAWAFSFPAYSHVKFGGVLAGEFYLWVPGSSVPLRLQEGDFYMLTDGQAFCSASDPNVAPVDGPSFYRAIRAADGVVRVCGNGDGYPGVSLASGRFTFEDDVSEILLRHLPPVIHLRAADISTTALALLLALLNDETSDLLPGSQVARSSLAALVLVHVLRMFLKVNKPQTGWLGALSDAKIGSALSLMHGQPQQRWTLERLASEVGMSRTAFANHFRRQVGSAPLAYLNSWRMTLARTALRHSNASLAEIADAIGYLSDTAFSIAFKRATGVSPGRFRVKHRAIAEDLRPASNLR